MTKVTVSVSLEMLLYPKLESTLDIYRNTKWKRPKVEISEEKWLKTHDSCWVCLRNAKRI